MECTDLKGSSAVVRDHAAYPRNHGPLEDFDGHARITGPCGDTMEFWLSVRNGDVIKASFITDGCGSSLACGSMAAILAEGKRIEDTAALRQQDVLNALGGLPPEIEHCALLAANTLMAACEDYLKRQKGVSMESRSEQTTCDTCGDLDETTVVEKTTEVMRQKEDKHMRIAIPLANGKLSMHFGHCECFALVDVDPDQKKIVGREDIDAPPHQPGLLPPWLAERGATMIIAGGMGQRAQDLFTEQGVKVLVGAPAETPEKLVADFLAETLQVGENVCDH